MIGSGKTKIVEFGSNGLTGVVSQCDRRLPACSDFRPATSRSYNGRCLHYSYGRWTWLLPLLARRSGIMPVRNSPRDPDSGTNSLQELFTFSSYCRSLLLAVLDPRVDCFMDKKLWRGVSMLRLCQYTLCLKKTCDYIFDDKLNKNCPFTAIFGTLITKSIGHRQMFF